MIIRPMQNGFGAYVEDIDLSRASIESELEKIRSYLGIHQVLCIRDQVLTTRRFQEVAESLGPLERYPYGKPIEGYPHVFRIVKEAHSRDNFGGVWHIDSPASTAPPAYTALLGIQIPPTGGDTLFANLYAAYSGLSNGMKGLLERMSGVFTSSAVHGSLANGLALGDIDRLSGVALADEEFIHPLIKVHPDSSGRALYISQCHMSRFLNFTVEESAPLLTYLASFITRPEFTMRISWKPNTLLIYDNRCVQHIAMNDYHGHRREIHRILIADKAIEQ